MCVTGVVCPLGKWTDCGFEVFLDKSKSQSSLKVMWPDAPVLVIQSMLSLIVGESGKIPDILDILSGGLPLRSWASWSICSVEKCTVIEDVCFSCMLVVHTKVSNGCESTISTLDSSFLDDVAFPAQRFILFSGTPYFYQQVSTLWYFLLQKLQIQVDFLVRVLPGRFSGVDPLALLQALNCLADIVVVEDSTRSSVIDPMMFHWFPS